MSTSDKPSFTDGFPPIGADFAEINRQLVEAGRVSPVTGNIKLVVEPPEADIAWIKAQLAELPPDRVDDLLARFEKQLAGDLLHVAECPGSPTRDAGDLVVRFRIDGLRECFAAAVRAAQIDADGFHGASQ